MRRAALLLAVAFLVLPASADEVVMKDGTVACLAKPYTTKGALAVFTLCDGRLVSFPLAQVDLERTAQLKRDPSSVKASSRLGYPPPAPVYRPSEDRREGASPLAAAGAASSPRPKGTPRAITLQGSAPAPAEPSAYYAPSAGSASGGGAPKTVHVSGYTRSDGKYVQGYDRSAPHSGGHSSSSGGRGGGKH